MLCLAHPPRTLDERPAKVEAASTREVGAMADKTTTWNNGASDGDLDNATNWTNGKPDAVSDWFVNFDGNVSNVAPTVNLDAPKTSLWNIKKWNFLSTYTAGIASVSDHLELPIPSPNSPSGTVLNYNVAVLGAGEYHIELNAADLGDAVVAMGPGAGNHVYLYDTVRNLWCLGGNVTIDGACSTAGILWLEGPGTLTVVRGSATTGFIDNIVRGGRLDTARDTVGATTLSIRGGIVEMTGIIATSAVVYVSGGRLLYRPASDASLAVPNLFAAAGIVELTPQTSEVNFTKLIIGPNATVLGAYGISDIYAGVSTAIDLRRDIP
jgi:hypothetical protein